MASIRSQLKNVFWPNIFVGASFQILVAALNDLVSSGKVLYWGMSDSPAWVCAEARTIADLRGWAPLSAIQLEYSLVERTSERELLPFARHNGIGVTYWAPLAGGILSGKHYTSEASIDSKRVARAEARRDIRIDNLLSAIKRLASNINVSPAQLSLAWLLNSSYNGIPIIGARTTEQLRDNLEALSIQLDMEVIEELNNVSSVELGFPHDFIASPRMQQVMYGPFKF